VFAAGVYQVTGDYSTRPFVIGSPMPFSEWELPQVYSRDQNGAVVRSSSFPLVRFEVEVEESADITLSDRDEDIGFVNGLFLNSFGSAYSSPVLFTDTAGAGVYANSTDARLKVSARNHLPLTITQARIYGLRTGRTYGA
jgi:hypothetical protein